MFSYEYLQIPDEFWIDNEVVSAIFQRIAAIVDMPQSGVINIAFLQDDEIQRLNNQYRWIDATTDVLSFHYHDAFVGLSQDEVAGEVILSESKIRSQATEYGNTIETEFYKLLIHSVLHILWYDHESDEEYIEMKAVEDEIVAYLGKNFFIKIH